MPDTGAREIGRVYAARGPWIDDVMPGDPADDVHFESRPIPEDAWAAFESSALCEHMHGLPHEGHLTVSVCSLPLQSTCSSAASFRLRSIALAFALVTATLSLGAHSTQSPSSSLKSESQTHLWHDSHL